MTPHHLCVCRRLPRQISYRGSFGLAPVGTIRRSDAKCAASNPGQVLNTASPQIIPASFQGYVPGAPLAICGREPLELLIEEFSEHAILFQEFLRRTALDRLAIRQDIDPVGLEDGCEPVSDYDRCGVLC